MTRLARRNRTRRIKLWKRRGYEYIQGSFWQRFTFRTVLVGLSGADAKFEAVWADLVPVVYEEGADDAS